MSNNFNDPNFDSRRFDPLKPKKFKSGEEFAHHQRIISEALRVGGWSKQIDPPDIERLVAKATTAFQEVENLIRAKYMEGVATGNGVNKLEAIKFAQIEFLDRFVKYSPDEVLVLLATFLTKSVIDRQL